MKSSKDKSRQATKQNADVMFLPVKGSTKLSKARWYGQSSFCRRYNAGIYRLLFFTPVPYDAPRNMSLPQCSRDRIVLHTRWPHLSSILLQDLSFSDIFFHGTRFSSFFLYCIRTTGCRPPRVRHLKNQNTVLTVRNEMVIEQYSS